MISTSPPKVNHNADAIRSSQASLMLDPGGLPTHHPPDRLFACAPFFVLPRPSPFRLRGGGKNRPRNSNATTSASSPTLIHTPSSSNTAKSSSKRSSKCRPDPSQRMKLRSSAQYSPLTDLEKLKVEEQHVQFEINRLNLALRDVEGDGNCLFRALSDQLYGDQKRHPEIRKLTCDYLELHEKELGFWAEVASFAEGEVFADYVKRMRKSGQYASEVEVHAAARMLHRNIRIVHADHSETIPCEYESTPSPFSEPAPVTPPEISTTPLPFLPEDMAKASEVDVQPDSPTTRRRTRSNTATLLTLPPRPASPTYHNFLADYLPSIKPGKSMLWLALFNDAEHYQSVRRKGDRERVPAEVEDKLSQPHNRDNSESARLARGEAAPGANPKISINGNANAKIVKDSLPSTHHFDDRYIDGILARVKNDVGEAIEILLEEINLEAGSNDDIMEGLVTLDDEKSEDTRGSGDSSHKVDEMLIDTPIRPLPSLEFPFDASLTAYQEKAPSSYSASPTPITSSLVPNSPSGSASTDSAQSVHSLSSKISRASQHSNRSASSHLGPKRHIDRLPYLHSAHSLSTPSINNHSNKHHTNASMMTSTPNSNRNKSKSEREADRLKPYNRPGKKEGVLLGFALEDLHVRDINHLEKRDVGRERRRTTSGEGLHH